MVVAPPANSITPMLLPVSAAMLFTPPVMTIAVERFPDRPPAPPRAPPWMVPLLMMVRFWPMTP